MRARGSLSPTFLGCISELSDICRSTLSFLQGNSANSGKLATVLLFLNICQDKITYFYTTNWYLQQSKRSKIILSHYIRYLYNSKDSWWTIYLFILHTKAELCRRNQSLFKFYNCHICPLPDSCHLAVGSLTRLAQVGAARRHLRAELCLPQLNLQYKSRLVQLSKERGKFEQIRESAFF